VRVVNIRGTGGAGKSTVVKAVMAQYPLSQKITVDGRKQPLGYIRQVPAGTPLPEGRQFNSLFVPGHYETPCGGCDTIKTPDQVYSLIGEAVDRGDDALYEGIIVGDDTRRAIELHKKLPEGLTVIHMDTPIFTCLTGIQARRDARGDARKLNEKNTVDRAKRIKRHCMKLKDAGVQVLRFEDRDEALKACLKIFGFVG
jgi:predicted kinase